VLERLFDRDFGEVVFDVEKVDLMMEEHFKSNVRS
jgi:hypothetical protein